MASVNKDLKPNVTALVTFLKLGLLGCLIGFGSFATEA